MELDIYTFGERTVEAETGRLISPAERLRRLPEEIELADQVGQPTTANKPASLIH